MIHDKANEMTEKSLNWCGTTTDDEYLDVVDEQ